MDAETQLKIILIEEHKNLIEIAKAQNTSIQNLSQKLKRNTIKYKEMQDIAEYLGYEIQWKKKNEPI